MEQTLDDEEEKLYGETRRVLRVKGTAGTESGKGKCGGS